MGQRMTTRYLIHKVKTTPENWVHYAIEIQHTVSWLMKEYGYEAETRRLEYMEALCTAAATILGPYLLFERMATTHNSPEVRSLDDILRCALTALAYLGDISRVKALLDAGVDVNAGSWVMGKLLQAAVARGHTEIAVLLLKNGADANSVNSKLGKTALQLACLAGHEEIVRILLSPEYNLKRSGESYEQALLNIAQADNVHLMRLLVQHGEAELLHRMQDKMLHQASVHGAVNMVRTLLDQGADIDSTELISTTPIQRAASGGHGEIVRLLIARGAQHGPKFPDPTREHECADDPHTIYHAVQLGFERVVDILLDAGDDISCNGRLSPLRAAVESEKIQVVQYLLSKGINPHSSGAETALNYAAKIGNERIVRILAAHGVDVDNHDRCPMFWALIWGRDNVVKTLLELGAQKVNVSESEYADAFASGAYPLRRPFSY